MNWEPDIASEARLIIESMADGAQLIEVLSSTLPTNDAMAAAIQHYQAMADESEIHDPHAIEMVMIVYRAVSDMRAVIDGLFGSVVAAAEDMTKGH